MRKVWILFLAISLVACREKPVQKSAGDAQPAVSQEAGSEVRLRVVPDRYDAVPDRVRLEIVNDTDQTIQFGADYRIQRHDPELDAWTEFGPPAHTAVIAIMYMLEPGKNQGYDIGLYPDSRDYISGDYRIVKRIFAGDDTREYTAGFRLE